MSDLQRFFPLFPGPDPLVQARVMGFTVGYKTIKATLAFEAAWSGLAAGSAALFLQPAPKFIEFKKKIRNFGQADPSYCPSPGTGRKILGHTISVKAIGKAEIDDFFIKDHGVGNKHTVKLEIGAD